MEKYVRDGDVVEIGFEDGNDVMMLEFKVKAGDNVKKNDELLVLESMKGTDSLQSPIDGEIVELNLDAQEDPEAMPKEFWLIKIKKLI